MTELLLHSEPYGELVLLPEAPALLVRWHGFANSRNLRFLLDKGLALYQHYAARHPGLRWLSDCRQFGAVLPADQQWAAADWNRQARAVGIRQIGLLAPENVFGQMAMQQYVHHAARSQSPLEVVYYSSLEQACRGFRLGPDLGRHGGGTRRSPKLKRSRSAG